MFSTRLQDAGQTCNSYHWLLLNRVRIIPTHLTVPTRIFPVIFAPHIPRSARVVLLIRAFVLEKFLNGTLLEKLSFIQPHPPLLPDKDHLLALKNGPELSTDLTPRGKDGMIRGATCR